MSKHTDQRRVPDYCDGDTKQEALLRELFCNYYARLVDPRDHAQAFSSLLRAFSDGVTIRKMGEAEFRRRTTVAMGGYGKKHDGYFGGCDYCGRRRESDRCDGCGAWHKVGTTVVRTTRETSHHEQP